MRNHHSSCLIGLGLLSATALLHVSGAQAAETTAAVALEEIIVTAERRESSLQDTALSVTALTGAEVESTGVTSFEDLLDVIPGVQVENTTGRGQGAQPEIAIRGLGTDGDNKPSSTAIYLDGIVVGAMGLQLYDLSRIEVLRGPQGTLYGGIATAGAVNIISNDPERDDYAGSGQIELGNYGLVHATGMFNAPLSDTVAVRAAFNTYQRHSYADSNVPFNSQVNGRVKLLVQPTDDLSVLLGAEIYRFNGNSTDGNQEYDIEGNYIGDYLPSTGAGVMEGNKGYVNINWDLGAATLTSISAYQEFSATTDEVSASAVHNSTPNRDTITQELRLASNNSDISWVAGLWYYDYKKRADILVGALPVLPVDSIVNGPFGPTSNAFFAFNEVKDDKQYSAFGQVTVPFGDYTRSTVGLRYSRDEIHYDQTFGVLVSDFAPPLCPPMVSAPCSGLTPFDESFTSTDWLLRLERDLTDENMMYLMASTGYRPGGVGQPNIPLVAANPDASVTSYDAEEVNAYEIGSKNRFADGRVQLNGSLYYNDYPSFQNSTALFGPNNVMIQTVVPVAAEIYGGEIELQALLADSGRLTASAAYIHATYTEDATFTDPLTLTSFSLATSGGTLPHAPELQVNVAYDHTFDLAGGGTLVAGANVHWQDEQAITFDACLYSEAACTSANPQTAPVQFIQSSYALVGAQLGYSSPNKMFTATLYGRNLTDELIKINTGFGRAGFAAPRTFGIVLGTKF